MRVKSKELTQTELAYYLHKIGFSIYGSDVLAKYLINKGCVFDATQLRLDFTEYKYSEDAAEDHGWGGVGDALDYLGSKTTVLPVDTNGIIIKEF
jgi:hypothetical protein